MIIKIQEEKYSYAPEQLDIIIHEDISRFKIYFHIQKEEEKNVINYINNNNNNNIEISFDNINYELFQLCNYYFLDNNIILLSLIKGGK